LLIAFFEGLQAHPKGKVASLVLVFVLFLGVSGNIYTSFADSISGEKYAKKMKSFIATLKKP
jgi:hypothetical protein